MNDALKLLSKSLKPLGYQIRKLNAPNLLRLKKVETREHSLKAMRLSQVSNFLDSDANLDKMIIYLRVCIRKNRNIDPKPRLGGSNLKDNTLRCIKSLIVSINKAIEMGTIELVVLDDRSDKSFLDDLEDLLKTCKADTQLKTTNTQGQGASLHEQFSLGKVENAILYFVEDDYLHEKDAIISAWSFYRQIARDFGTHCVIYPQEHEILYRDLYPSYIVASPDRHWRTIRHATHTFITHGHIVDKYWDYFENTKYVGIRKKRRLGSEAKTTNKLFNHIPGFSPLQPIAVHFQFDSLLPPFYNWKTLWDKNKI